jgi:hypothetical protein
LKNLHSSISGSRKSKIKPSNRASRTRRCTAGLR